MVSIFHSRRAMTARHHEPHSPPHLACMIPQGDQVVGCNLSRPSEVRSIVRIPVGDSVHGPCLQGAAQVSGVKLWCELTCSPLTRIES